MNSVDEPAMDAEVTAPIPSPETPTGPQSQPEQQPAFLPGAMEPVEEEPLPKGLASELLAGMETWTDRELINPPEETTDLYTLWSAMTAVSQEVKLQARAFHQLQETLAPVAEIPASLRETLNAHEKAIEVAQKLAEENRTLVQRGIEEARESAREETLEVFMDLRDRLIRGRRTAQDHLRKIDEVKPAGWFKRWRSRSGPETSRSDLHEATIALETGYTLSIDRVQETLREFGIVELVCLDKPFDPHRMKAVDLEDRDDLPSGTVIEVYRPGYERHGRVLRLPEVKVSRNSTL